MTALMPERADTVTPAEFEHVHLETAVDAGHYLVDGAAMVRTGQHGHRLFTVHRVSIPGEDDMITLRGDGQTFHFNPAWHLPATIIYTPQEQP